MGLAQRKNVDPRTGGGGPRLAPSLRPQRCSVFRRWSPPAFRDPAATHPPGWPPGCTQVAERVHAWVHARVARLMKKRLVCGMLAPMRSTVCSGFSTSSWRAEMMEPGWVGSG